MRKREDVYNIYLVRGANFQCAADKLKVLKNEFGGVRELQIEGIIEAFVPELVYFTPRSILKVQICAVDRIEWRSTLDETEEGWSLVFKCEDYKHLPSYAAWNAAAAIVETHIRALRSRFVMGMDLSSDRW
mgnify:CR=1 FL=1